MSERKSFSTGEKTFSTGEGEQIEKRGGLLLFASDIGGIETRKALIGQGVGLLICSHWRDPTPYPYFAVDNGAFSAWKNGKEWEPSTLLHILKRCSELRLMPEFVVCPDIVAGGLDSLKHSLAWLDKLPQGFPYYLAVQDGMEIEDIEPSIHRFAGIFVGGTMSWKLRTARAWTSYAHSHGLRCHIGRMGTWSKIVFARDVAKADSIDSTTWIQAKRGRRHLSYANMQQSLEVI